MKKTLIFLMIALVFMAIVSCQKDADPFVGDYSFKTSGEITFTMETHTDSSDFFLPALINLNLTNDIGQLNISHDDDNSYRVAVVINYLNGDVIVTSGSCDGKTIQLDEYRRQIIPISVNPLLTDNFYVKVQATGHIYDNDMIIFDMSYKGKVTIGPATFNIKDKDVKMVAYRN